MTPWRSKSVLLSSLLAYSTCASGVDHDYSTITTQHSKPISIKPIVEKGKDSNVRDKYTIHDMDHDFEEKLMTGDVDPSEIPLDLLVLDEDGDPIIPQHTQRRLSENSVTIGKFSPLTGNPSSWTGINCDSNVSDNLPSPGNPLTIPFGECYTFDVGSNVTLADGIDIKGKLVFPTNHQATIYTPFIIVQGELELSVEHDTISPQHIATRFILIGTDDVLFSPSDAPNQNACYNQTNGVCNLGPKPFVVAGGKVNIQSMPESCSTHTPIMETVYKDPVYDPSDFQMPVTLSLLCSNYGSNRHYISYDFEDNNVGNWTGRPGAFTVASDGAVRFENRMLERQGPYLDVTPLRPASCLVPNQDYLFVAR
jgi:hypothetical protein